MEFALILLVLGVWAYLAFGGLTTSIKCITDASVKRAEAKARGREADARAEEARTERARLEHDKPLT